MNTDTITSFGTWLKQRRRAIDLTQQDLARRVGCSLETIVKIESGERRPSKQVAERLAECLGVPADEHSAFVQYARVEQGDEYPLMLAQADDRAPWRTLHHFHRLQSHPNNLPAQPNPFIGREKQVATAVRLLRRPGVRLVSMTGPPGVGKTRLSLQVAADLLNEFDSGVYFAALAPITDPRLVASAIARTLGVREAGKRPILDSLKSYLRDKRLLLVLDNFEQVVPSASLVAELLAAAPLVKALVTSRAALHVYGEYELRIPPLALPGRRQTLPIEQLREYEAVELFAERALAANPDFALNRDNAETVAEICRLLDGLPLAIELAAARTRFLSPQVTLERLESGTMKLLVGGPTNLPARQRTLRSAISWSYDLLDEEEKRLFRRLAVFVGGCDVGAVEGICGGDDGRWVLSLRRMDDNSIVRQEINISDSIASLIDKNLLRIEEQEHETRYRMLETIRDYALERLAEGGEKDIVFRRYAEYYLALAERAEPELRGSDQRAWLDLLEREHDNLRAALHWAITEGEAEIGLRLAGALGWFWFRRGHFSEGWRWLDEMRNAEFGVRRDLGSSALRIPHSAFAKALIAAGRLADHQGDYISARRFYEESCRIYEGLGNKEGIGYGLCGLGFTNFREGNREQAGQVYGQALDIFRDLSDTRGIATALRGLADLALHEGEYERAQALYTESLALFQELDDKYIVATSLNGLGNVALDTGDYAQALTRYEESLRLFRELDDRYGIAGSLLSMGEVSRCLGDYDAARPQFEESLDIWKSLGEKWNLAMTLHNLGHVAHHQAVQHRSRLPSSPQSARGEHKYHEAGAIFMESLVLFREVGARVGVAMCLAGLAGLETSEYPDKAARLFGAADELLQTSGTPLQAADLEDYNNNVAAAREQLEAHEFDALRKEGQNMNMEQAIIFALALRSGEGVVSRGGVRR